MGPSTTGRTAASLAQLRGVNFVSGCRFSHRNQDDPIVYPGQPGKSHDHSFIGNDTTNAFSTLASLQGQSSSCRRAGDTAAYWMPTLLSRVRDADHPAARDGLLPPAHDGAGAGVPARIPGDRRQLEGDDRAGA